MDRFLKTGGSVASALAAVALVLGLMASPVGQVKADDEGAVPIKYCESQVSNCVNNGYFCVNPNKSCVYDSVTSACICF